MRGLIKKRRVSAFTLVELMVALGVFAIVFASAFYCIQASSRLIDTARHHTRAAQIMQSEIESIRSMAWANMTSLPTVSTAISLDRVLFDQTVYAKYTLTRTIEGSGNVRKIIYNLSWKARNKTYNRSYVAVYTQGGLYDYIQ